MRPAAAATAGTLAALGGLHLAWAAGSSFPAASRADLADLVAGTDEVPGVGPSTAVAAALGAAAALVADVAPLPPPIRRIGVVGVVSVLGLRGLAGLTGRTRLLVPWEPSPSFVRRDRRRFGPLCLALALGAVASLRG